jgi:hypothetical protein
MDSSLESTLVVTLLIKMNQHLIFDENIKSYDLNNTLKIQLN